jgi:hypothetical protein
VPAVVEHAFGVLLERVVGLERKTK